MSLYKAPLSDIYFIRDELLNYPSHYKKFACGENASADIVSAILEESARFSEEVLAPLNRIGDLEGCILKDRQVTTPKGFKEAYHQYIANGWPSLAYDTKLGGQGLPQSLGFTVNEIIATANWAWNMYPGLSHGAISTLMRHGSDELQAIYLPNLISGKWTGTMCLTEPQCGSDLNLLKTQAIKHGDNFLLEGTKIFISSGEHDMSENIIHIVLARLPDSPAGTKGISIFLVPKYLPDKDGNLTVNNLSCGGLEKKMGIHGNATCVMNFDRALGFLLGEINKGLSCMFTFMNFARLGTALQGLVHAETAWQNAWHYTNERKQGRNLNDIDKKNIAPQKLVEHADIRRMLLTIRAFVEGNRVLYYYTCQLVDLVLYSQNSEESQQANSLLEFLTPICKAFMTETGYEAANLSVQCFGGHGYISEYGIEQNLRDARIATIYEGTTYIQSLDLLGRKILMTQGELLKNFTKIIHLFCKKHAKHEKLQPLIVQLNDLNKQWSEITMNIGEKAMDDREEVGAVAYDYMMWSGYVCLAWVWLKSADVAWKKLEQKTNNEKFYRQKIATANFYFARILPRTTMHKQCIDAGLKSLLMS